MIRFAVSVPEKFCWPVFELVFDAPRHKVLVAGKEVHAPDRAVGEVLFDVGEAGHGLALSKVLATSELRISEHSDAVAQRASELAGRVELDELVV